MKAFVLGLLFLTSNIMLYGQNKISEGNITYSVEWNLPEQMQEMQSNFPTEIKVYFKGDSSSTVTESQMYSSNFILNPVTQFEKLLLDIPLMHKKYAVTFTPEDRKKMADKMPQIELKDASETKTLVGYQVHKYAGIEKKGNQTFDAWFTKDVEVLPNALSRFYDKSCGFPVEFTTFLNGLSLKASLKEIKKSAVPAGLFSAGKDYEEITVDQLMQMSGGEQ